MPVVVIKIVGPPGSSWVVVPKKKH